jgi:outer membrane protein OmpA-like peptidoglycan-associated protein
MKPDFSKRRVPAVSVLSVAIWLVSACATPEKPRTAPAAAPAVVVDADLASQFGVALAGTAAELRREGRRLRVVLPARMLFVTDTATVAPQASTALAPMLAVMGAHRGLHVKIHAHTDSIGSKAFNDEFSRQRAEAARQWLMEHGVPGDGVEAHGAGEGATVADNTTPAGRERNRRVELLLGPG